MAEQDLEHPQVPIDTFASVGQRLRQARERLGLSRADVAARTKIAERHLAAIEEERFADLASSTYAVGFSRAYARAVGLDEREIAQAARGELDLVDDGEARPAPTFEPGDPARVPSSRTAWLAGLGALAVVIAVLVFWRGYYFPAGSLPDLTAQAPSAAVAPKPIAPAAASASPGAVVITAREGGVWVRVMDVAGRQLFQKQLAAGESYTVPADANGPQLRTARPDALAITVGGRPVPPLGDKPSLITAPVSAAALLARAAPAALPPPAAVAAPPPAAQGSPRASASAPAPRASASPSPPATPRPRPSAAAPVAASPTPTTAAASPSAAAPPAPAPSPAAEAGKASTVSQ
jgi:cytoskeletal protein RodZ